MEDISKITFLDILVERKEHEVIDLKGRKIKEATYSKGISQTLKTDPVNLWNSLNISIMLCIPYNYNFFRTFKPHESLFCALIYKHHKLYNST